MIKIIFKNLTEKIKVTEAQMHVDNKLLDSMKNIIKVIYTTIKLCDPYTAGHQERVTTLAVAIVQKLNLSFKEIEGLQMAALVHDLGKLCIPVQILNKPGELSDIEYQLIKTHPQEGCKIIRDIELPWPISEIVLQHHERINGSGYPNRLMCSEILLEARILAVADVVEAITSHRPYRPALGIDEALKEISINIGRSYDEDVVKACIEVFEEGFQFK